MHETSTNGVKNPSSYYLVSDCLKSIETMATSYTTFKRSDLINLLRKVGATETHPLNSMAILICHYQLRDNRIKLRRCSYILTMWFHHLVATFQRIQLMFTSSIYMACGLCCHIPQEQHLKYQIHLVMQPEDVHIFWNCVETITMVETTTVLQVRYK